jgi:hypothetical protein
MKKNAPDTGRCSPIRRRDRLNLRSGITRERSRYSRAAYSAKLNYKSVCLTWKPATLACSARLAHTEMPSCGSSSGLDIVMSMLADRGRMDSDRARSSSDDAGVKAGISDLQRRLGCGDARLYETPFSLKRPPGLFRSATLAAADRRCDVPGSRQATKTKIETCAIRGRDDAM